MRRKSLEVRTKKTHHNHSMFSLRFYFNSITSNLPVMPFMTAKKTQMNVLSDLIKKLSPLSSGRKMIRVGPDKDGGYLVPDDLNGILECFSPGVADEAGFELDCANRGMKVYMADASVEAPPFKHENFHFIKKYLGSYSSDTLMTLDSWVSEKSENSTSELILQIDIEGAEYEVFINASEELMNRFRIIVVEFHNLDYLFDSAFFGVAKSAFEKILRKHSCVHIHPNNTGGVLNSSGIGIPMTMEFTFYRNDRMPSTKTPAHIPHALDVDCNPKQPTIKIPECWKSIKP